MLLCATAALGAENDAPIEFVPPPFLTGPVVARSLLGVTYAYHAADPAARTGLQISIVALPADIRRSGVSAERCIALFMTEVAKGYRKFFALPTGARLEAGPFKLSQARWTAKDGKDRITGITGCTVDRDRYISINFQDAIGAAPASFPAIRARLKGLKIRDGEPRGTPGGRLQSGARTGIPAIR
jgi:hypothetical protein